MVAAAPPRSPEYERTVTRIRCVELTLAGLHEHELHEREREQRGCVPVDLTETVATFERELAILERRLRALSG